MLEVDPALRRLSRRPLHVAASPALQRARAHPRRRRRRRRARASVQRRRGRAAATTCRSRISSSARWPRCGCSRARGLDVLDPRSRAGRPARRGQHRRRRRRGGDERRPRPRRLSRPDARGHRPREGRHLPRRAPGGLRRPRSARDASTASRATIGARLLVIGRDYGYVDERTQWRYSGPARRALRPAVSRVARRVPARERGDRARGARPAARPPAGRARRRSAKACSPVELPGRFQVLPGRPAIVLDVAHNPHAARALADALGAMGFHPRDDRRVRHARRQGHRAA